MHCLSYLILLRENSLGKFGTCNFAHSIGANVDGSCAQYSAVRYNAAGGFVIGVKLLLPPGGTLETALSPLSAARGPS